MSAVSSGNLRWFEACEYLVGNKLSNNIFDNDR